MAETSKNAVEVHNEETQQRYKVKWYRSTLFNATILGLCNFAAPGIWGAMNSLGAGGAEKPYLVDAANALTFCLMVLTCWLSSGIVHYVGVKGALMLGTLGYAVYAAGLYTNNRYGTEWLVLFGAAACGLSAGVFWAVEAAIAIAYPEPYNRGKLLGYWLTYRLAGQVLGGAINLGINANNDKAGKVSYTVYLIFIALQCTGPLVALFLTPPSKVERTDGKKVDLSIPNGPWYEIRETTRLFFTKEWLLIVLFIGQAVFAEAVYFTYLSLWFTVRARALGSFICGVVAVICGNLAGHFLDWKKLSLRVRTRAAFALIVICQGAWWIWATILVTRYRVTQPTFDWTSDGFGAGFGIFVLLGAGFQVNYLFLYFIVSNLSKDPEQVIRYASLLRGTESAWQAVSYGLSSVHIFAVVGGVYLNFGLWAVSILPAWLVIRHFGTQSHLAADFGHTETFLHEPVSTPDDDEKRSQS